jgi:Lrp/AsnC family transcriptional regulator
MDSFDWKIVEALQRDASLTVQEVADHVGLTANPCWRRIRRLEEDGVIAGRVAIVDAELLGIKLTAFMTLRTGQHDARWLAEFAQAVEDIAEIVECHRMSGASDYLLKVMVTDMTHYDRVYQKLIARVPSVVDISSNFSMERIKVHSTIRRSMIS